MRKRPAVSYFSSGRRVVRKALVSALPQLARTPRFGSAVAGIFFWRRVVGAEMRASVSDQGKLAECRQLPYWVVAPGRLRRSIASATADRCA
jgi:hypothetical protein